MISCCMLQQVLLLSIIIMPHQQQQQQHQRNRHHCELLFLSSPPFSPISAPAAWLASRASRKMINTMPRIMTGCGGQPPACWLSDES